MIERWQAHQGKNSADTSNKHYIQEKIGITRNPNGSQNA